MPKVFAGEGRFVGPPRDVTMEQADVEGVGKDRTRFFFKIQDGCDNFCGYCIVPFARGPVRSRPEKWPPIHGGAGETGHQGSRPYRDRSGACRDPSSRSGRQGAPPIPPAGPTPPRVRLSSVDPGYIDGLVPVIAASDKIAKNIHIPAQSGSDRILEAMGRTYAALSDAIVEG